MADWTIRKTGDNWRGETRVMDGDRIVCTVIKDEDAEQIVAEHNTLEQVRSHIAAALADVRYTHAITALAGKKVSA